MNSQALSSPIVNLLNDPFFMDLYLELETSKDENQIYDAFVDGSLELEDFVCNDSCVYQTLTTKPGQRNVVTCITNPSKQVNPYLQFVWNTEPILDPEWDWWFNTQTMEDYKQEKLTPVSDCVLVWNFVQQEYSASRIRVFY